jgi:hypothetical protein
MMDKPRGPLIYTIRKGADVIPRRVFYLMVAVLIVVVVVLGLVLYLRPR